jgi:transposase-like protein
VDFYPSTLERGLRSEQALKLAMAEMYVKGVSTRKVKDIMEQLFGLEVASIQVSRAAQLLDEEIENNETVLLAVSHFFSLMPVTKRCVVTAR